MPQLATGRRVAGAVAPLGGRQYRAHMRLALVLPLLFGLTGPAAAQVTVAVRARAVIDDLRATPEGRQAEVRGVLRDDLGRPVPRATVYVAGERQRTDGLGRFAATLHFTHDARHVVPVRFDGTPLLGAAAAQLPVTTGRRGTTLSLALPPQVPADAAYAVVPRLTGPDGQPEADARLGCQVDQAPAQAAVTDAQGRAQCALPPLAPGAHTLTITFPGDAARGPARWTRGFEAARPMGVTLTRVASAEGVEVTGQVRPGPGAVYVSVSVDGQPVDQTLTDAQGRWRLALDGLSPGVHTLRAQAQSAAPGWADGLSAPLTVRLADPAPPRSAWWLVPGLLAVVAVAATLWRQRPQAAAQRARPPTSPVVAALTYGPTAAAPSDRLSLRIVDALDGAPLSGRVWALPADAAPTVQAPPPGAGQPVQANQPLRVTPVPAQIWVEAPGHGPARLGVRHGGAATVQLLPSAAWVQRRFDEVLRAAGRPALRFGTDTPREAAAALRARGADAAAVDALLAVVEPVCFDPTATPDVRAVDALADAAQRTVRP